MSLLRPEGLDAVTALPLSSSRAGALHWILRLGVSACFVGEGAMDNSIAVLSLAWPLPAVLLWAVLWALQTACLRPLSGAPLWGLLVRAGAVGVPLALLWSGGWPRSLREWLSPVRPGPLDERRTQQLGGILGVATAALLIGQGGLGALMHRAEWVGYFATIGLGPSTITRLSVVEVAGWFSIGLGLAILAKPRPGLVLVACAWILGIAWLRPVTGQPVWDIIGRGGSCSAPLALLWLRGAAWSSGGRSRLRSLRHLHRLRVLLDLAPACDSRGQYQQPRNDDEGGGRVGSYPAYDRITAEQAVAPPMLTAHRDDQARSAARSTRGGALEQWRPTVHCVSAPPTNRVQAVVADCHSTPLAQGANGTPFVVSPSSFHRLAGPISRHPPVPRMRPGAPARPSMRVQRGSKAARSRRDAGRALASGRPGGRRPSADSSAVGTQGSWRSSRP